MPLGGPECGNLVSGGLGADGMCGQWVVRGRNPLGVVTRGLWVMGEGVVLTPPACVLRVQPPASESGAQGFYLGTEARALYFLSIFFFRCCCCGSLV